MGVTTRVISGDSGTDRVEVIDDGQLVWQFVPSPDGSSITFCQCVDDHRLAVLDERGRLRLYALHDHALIHEQDFRSDISGCGAVLAADRRTLYVTAFRLGARLIPFDLQRLECGDTMTLPAHAETETFWRDRRGRLLFYTLNGSWDDKEQHQSIYRLDPSTGDGEDFPLSAPPSQFWDRKLPVFDFDRGVGIRRLYRVHVEETADGLRYHNRVAVFDLETFTDQHVITTRAYTAGHLGYGPPHESDNTTAATLRRPAPTADYHTTLTDFADDLTSIHVCSDEPAFWVCFRDGILRRIALDGSHRSALVAFDRLPGRPSEDPFSRKYLHASICSDCSTDDRIVVESTCDELLGFDPTGLDLSDEAALVLVTPEPVDRQTVTRSEEQRQETEDLDRNVVPVADVDDPAALSAALDDLVRRFDDIDALRRGHTLLFVFRDPAGAEIDEADFFARAVTLDGGPERIAIILRRFIAFPGHEDLYRDEETVALAHALHALVLHDAAYLGLYADYYRELDVEHDVYNRETLLPAIFAQYDWSPALLQLLGVLEVVDPDAAELHGDDPALLALLAQDEHLRTLVDAIRTADTHDSYDPADGAGSRAGYRRLLAERFGAVAEQADAARGGAAQLIAQATGMGTAGDWAGALPLLVEAVRIDPTGLDARNLHAYALVALDDAAAPAALQAVLALDPHNAAALSNLALWHFRHGDREQGADAYRRMFATQPPAETLYHCFLCDVHGADHPLAEEAAEVFLALARSRDPEFESHAMTFAQLANDRARIQSAIQSGCCADAIDLARHHCEQAKAFYADEPARISEALHALGSVLEGAGAYEEAIAAYSEGAAIDQDGNSLESIDWAGAALKHNAIAECYRKSGDFSTCRQYYRFALDQGQTAWGDQHPHLAVFHANQAVCDMQLGFLEQAQEGFTTALAMAEAGLGPDHPDLATMLNNYAQLRLRQGRASEAVALAERAVANESAAYGSDHPATAMSMVVLANALLGDDRSDDARQVAQQAFAILSATWGADHPSVAGAHGLLGRLALADGDADTAVEHLHQATTIIAATTGDTSPDTAESRVALGHALLRAGQAAAAIPVLAEAYEVSSRTIGMQHPALLGILRDRARALAVTDDVVAAAEVLLEYRRTALQQEQPALAYEAGMALALICLHAGLASAAAEHLATATQLTTEHDDLPPPEATPLLIDLLQDHLVAEQVEEAFTLHTALLTLVAAGAHGDLTATHKRYRSQLAPSHIAHALCEREVFVSTLPGPHPTAVFLVAQDGIAIHPVDEPVTDLAAYLAEHHPGAILVDVATMLERTPEQVRQDHEDAAEAHDQQVASLEQESLRLQAEMQQAINAAIAEGRYGEVAAITAAYTEKLMGLGQIPDS